VERPGRHLDAAFDLLPPLDLKDKRVLARRSILKIERGIPQGLLIQVNRRPEGIAGKLDRAELGRGGRSRHGGRGGRIDRWAGASGWEVGRVDRGRRDRIGWRRFFGRDDGLWSWIFCRIWARLDGWAVRRGIAAQGPGFQLSFVGRKAFGRGHRSV